MLLSLTNTYGKWPAVGIAGLWSIHQIRTHSTNNNNNHNNNDTEYNESLPKPIKAKNHFLNFFPLLFFQTFSQFPSTIIAHTLTKENKTTICGSGGANITNNNISFRVNHRCRGNTKVSSSTKIYHCNILIFRPHLEDICTSFVKNIYVHTYFNVQTIQRHVYILCLCAFWHFKFE